MSSKCSDEESPATVKLSNPVARLLLGLKLQMTSLNFIQLHYIYFIGVTLLSAVVFWGSSTPSRSVTFTDALFLCG